MSEVVQTEDSLAAAFKALATGATEPVAAPPAATEPAASTETPAIAEPAPSDELTALRAELDSTRRNASQSIDWGRKGYLRASNEATTAKRLLKQALENPEGVSKEEVARFLGGSPAQPEASQNPWSQAPAVPDERLQMDASQFILDYGLSEKQVGEFTAWMNSPTGQSAVKPRDVVEGDYYSTFRHSWERYKETVAPDPKVLASVARTQREVAKASGAPSRIMPTPEPEPAPDPMKLTVQQRIDNGTVDGWFKQLNQEWANH